MMKPVLLLSLAATLISALPATTSSSTEKICDIFCFEGTHLSKACACLPDTCVLDPLCGTAPFQYAPIWDNATSNCICAPELKPHCLSTEDCPRSSGRVWNETAKACDCIPLRTLCKNLICIATKTPAWNATSQKCYCGDLMPKFPPITSLIERQALETPTSISATVITTNVVSNTTMTHTLTMSSSRTTTSFPACYYTPIICAGGGTHLGSYMYNATSGKCECHF